MAHEKYAPLTLTLSPRERRKGAKLEANKDSASPSPGAGCAVARDN